MKSKFTKWILLISTITLVLWVCIFDYIHWKSRKVIVDIGPYPNLQSEQRASLQRLSLELKHHPDANAVRIVAGKSAWRKGVMGFIRSSPDGNNVFWYDDRFSSPAIGYVNGKLQGIGEEILVSDEPIQVVARKNGTVADVDNYNEHLRERIGLDKP